MTLAALDQDQDLARLLDRVVEALSPTAVYLFGSRASGMARDDSDYDLLVVVPDETPADRLRPQNVYRLARDVRVAADIVTCRASGFERCRDAVGTLSYEAAHFGRLVHGE
ncbi:MAG: nucleotidyltransferase domain-containing protein [Alphaproteobacteria bacterium]